VLRHAFRKKVKELETDNANMRQFSKEKQNQVVMLEQKIASLEGVVDDMTRRAKELASENAKVASERDALAENVKKLTKDMKRLDHFKRSILNTIETDTDASGAPAASNYQDLSYLPPSISEPQALQASALRTPSPPRGVAGLVDSDGGVGQASRFPEIGSNNAPAEGGSSPTAMAQVDGKEFFKRARHRLSFQQFNAFLANIKKLNSHLQTREETLANAAEIFGPENQDLHDGFTGLLSRHGV